ncbi:hypothetical protein ABDK00_004970 [Niabella insulamsoli]|uniref:hypothetical protein n=1 Tax=Niabella insulamsoli TaxID=3144874 RepID=UPI0031FCE5D5
MKKSILFMAVATIVFLTLNSCSKDDAPGGTYTIQYKLVGSPGVVISNAVYATDGTGGMETRSNIGSQNFETDVFTFANDGYPSMSCNATGPNNNSTLKAQIFKNGKLLKESTATGEILVISVSGAGSN